MIRSRLWADFVCRAGAAGLVGAANLAGGIGFAAAFAPAPVFAGTVEASYVITLAGLTIGKANLSGLVEGPSYTLSVSAALTGLIGAVSKGSGSASSQGGLGSGAVQSNGFKLVASNGKQTRTILMSVAAGNVRGVSIEPPFETGQDDRVPLGDAHRAGVLDPLSALMMPARSANPLDKSNCERRLPVFDGTQRFDVVLAYIGTREVKSEAGYSGPVLMCSVRYVPVAGHRPSRRAIKFMADNRELSVWLAPVNGGKVLVPYRISVKTMIGTSVIEARRFVVSAP